MGRSKRSGPQWVAAVQEYPQQHLAPFLAEVFRSSEKYTLLTFLRRGEQIETKLTAAELREKALHLAEILSTKAPSRAPALLIFPAGPDFSLTLLACLFAGIVAVPLPEPRPGSADQRLETVLADSQATLILSTQSSARRIRDHLLRKGRSQETLPTIIPVDDPELDKNGPARSVLAGFDATPHSPVIVQYTSGSTRSPQGIPLSSTNILSNAALVATSWGKGRSDVAVSWLPHFHDMGLLGGTLYPFIWGARIIHMPPLSFVQRPHRWLRAISQYKGTLSGAPAFAFALCLDTMREHDLGELDLSCWQTAYCGGEPVPTRLLAAFRQRFAAAGLRQDAVFPCYGLAEASLLVAGTSSASAAKNQADPAIDSVRQRTAPCRLTPLMRDRLRIVDPQTRRPVPDGEEGEIWVKGPSVAHGSLDLLRDDSDPEPFLRTGDWGVLEPQGLFITGRLKEVLIASGMNVTALDIEWLAAEQHPALNPHAAAAFELDPSQSTEAVLLIERRTHGSTIDDPVALERHIRMVVVKTLGVHLRTIRFLPRGKLERTTSGKIRRREIAAHFRASDPQPQQHRPSPARSDASSSVFNTTSDRPTEARR